jgi:hypothetical protein
MHRERKRLKTLADVKQEQSNARTTAKETAVTQPVLPLTMKESKSEDSKTETPPELENSKVPSIILKPLEQKKSLVSKKTEVHIVLK